MPRNGYTDTRGWVFLRNKAILAAFLWFADANPSRTIATWRPFRGGAGRALVSMETRLRVPHPSVWDRKHRNSKNAEC